MELFAIVVMVAFILHVSKRRKKHGCKRTIKHYSTYERLLEDKRWKAKREEVLRLHNGKCQWCGARTNLQVHHPYYNKYPDGTPVEPWDYPTDKLMLLCDACHKKYHSKYKVRWYYRKFGKHY